MGKSLSTITIAFQSFVALWNLVFIIIFFSVFSNEKVDCVFVAPDTGICGFTYLFPTTIV